MKVIKPGKLGMLTRCFEVERQTHLGISALLFVPLRSACLLSEVSLWTFVGRRLGRDAILDAAIPKSRAEFVVSGVAYCPGGVPATSCPVRARFGGREKILQVFGDRRWEGSRATEPEPFLAMPIDWEHAYGGVRYAKNPRGKGHRPVEIAGERVHPLPNVERPDRRVDAPSRRVDPAGFLPLDIAWPQRAGLAGTYDTHWRRNLFPGFARDIAWEIFNVAPADQRMDERAWNVGETFEFQNLHPTLPWLGGSLPSWRARAFITHSATGPAELREVMLGLQTVWFFPDAERAVLVFTGSVPVASDDAADVLALLGAVDLDEAPRPSEHYVEVLARRLDRETAAMASLREADLLPPIDAAPVEDEFAQDRDLVATEGFLQRNLHRKAVAQAARSRALIASHGLDPDVHGPPIPAPPPPPPTPDEIPELVARLQADAEQRRIDTQERIAQSRRRIDALVDAAGIDGFDSQVLAQEREQAPLGPPTFSAEGQRARLRELAAHGRARGTVVEEIEAMLTDDALDARWRDAEARLRESYRQTAHLQDPAPLRPAADQAALRAQIQDIVERRGSLEDRDLTGVDLSGMDLSGADLSGALLESARLEGTRLTGAKLVRTVLAHASLCASQLEGADLRGSNLGGARFVDCALGGADLTDVVLERATFIRTALDGCRLVGARIVGARFEDSRARGGEATGLLFMENTLQGFDLGDARLEGSTWIRVDLSQVCFSRAHLEASTFVACGAAGVGLEGAHLHDARFVDHCSAAPTYEDRTCTGRTWRASERTNASGSREPC